MTAIVTTYDAVTDNINIFYDPANNEYWCLNDLNKFVPSKRLDHFMENQDTKEFIEKVSQTIIPGVPVIIQKRGRGGGTYAHELIALRFIAWLSKDFELHIYKIYNDYRKNHDDWSKERIITKYEFHLLTDTIKDYIAPTYPKDKQGIAYARDKAPSNKPNLRETATTDELQEVSDLQHANKTLIMLDVSLTDRENLLKKMLLTKRSKHNAISTN